MSDQNAGRRVFITGDAIAGYKVYTLEPDGTYAELDCRSVTITVYRDRDGSTSAIAAVYFTSPILVLEAPRHADGVRAG